MIDAVRARDAANEVADRVAEHVPVASAILHGSLVLGDFGPASDIDLLVLTERPLDDSARAHVLRAVADFEPPAPIDLRFVAAASVQPPQQRPVLDLYVRLRPGAEPQVEGGPVHERDLLPEFSVCREHGRSLVGEPRTIIWPVPDDWILETIDAQLRDWQRMGDDPEHAELTVLSTCRAWRVAAERTHCSKEEAAAWVLSRDPSLLIVRDALEVRHGRRSEPLDPVGVTELLARARAQLAG